MNFLLVDKSAYEIRRRSPEAQRSLDDMVGAGGVIAMCEMVALELLYSARNSEEYERLHAGYMKLSWLDTTNTALRRAIDVQHELARRGQHSRPLPDLIIAATAEDHGATVVHYDKDFELSAEVTQQPTQWVVPAGTL